MQLNWSHTLIYFRPVFYQLLYPQCRQQLSEILWRQRHGSSEYREANFEALHVCTATTKGQYSLVRLEQARLVRCLYDTRLLMVKSTSGGLHLKGFRRDVFLMARGTQTKASYHEFEKQFIDVKSP